MFLGLKNKILHAMRCDVWSDADESQVGAVVCWDVDADHESVQFILNILV